MDKKERRTQERQARRQQRKERKPKRVRPPLTPEQRRKRANRRAAIFSVLSKLAFLVILIGAAVLALTVFFRVRVIRVEGATRYSPTEIAEAMNIHEEDNLYLWNKFKAGDELLVEFPYIEQVLIRRHLPDTLTVTVTECKAAFAVPSDGGYYLLSSSGKVLEQAADSGGLPVVTGVSLLGTGIGQKLDASGDAYVNALVTLIEALKESGMTDGIQFINLQTLTDIRIGYLGRFDLRIGTVDQALYRLRFAKTVIEERLSPSDIGRLYWDTKKQLHFVPETAEQIAAAAMPDPEQEKTVVFHADGQAVADPTKPADDTQAASEDMGDTESAPTEDTADAEAEITDYEEGDGETPDTE